MLAASQYAANVEIRRHSGERVEFAVRLPGLEETGPPVWLPIDAKLHQEDYQRLLDAQDGADPEGAAIAGKALERTFRSAARTIAELYVCPPETTDFAILFVPVEGLYAEILRPARPGRRGAARFPGDGGRTDHPLRPAQQPADGFPHPGDPAALERGLGGARRGENRARTLRRPARESPEKIQEAGNVIDQARTRSRTMSKKLRSVQELPAAEAQGLLGLAEVLPEEAAEPAD